MTPLDQWRSKALPWNGATRPSACALLWQCSGGRLVASWASQKTGSKPKGNPKFLGHFLGVGLFDASRENHLQKSRQLEPGDLAGRWMWRTKSVSKDGIEGLDIYKPSVQKQRKKPENFPQLSSTQIPCQPALSFTGRDFILAFLGGKNRHFLRKKVCFGLPPWLKKEREYKKHSWWNKFCRNCPNYTWWTKIICQGRDVQRASGFLRR